MSEAVIWQLITAAGTIIGTWYTMKYRIGRAEEDIKAIKDKDLQELRSLLRSLDATTATSIQRVVEKVDKLIDHLLSRKEE